MVHGRLAQFFPQASNLAVPGVVGVFCQRLLAASQKGVTPCRQASSGSPQLSREQVQIVSAQES
jgi:hypothetical protein